MYNTTLLHYGTPRRSGRYPWGSGNDGYQRANDFLDQVEKLKSKGLSEKEIAKGLGFTTTELRPKISLARSEIRAASVAEAIRLKNKGMSNTAIGNQMGINESSVRSLLDNSKKDRMDITKNTINMLKDSVDKRTYIDVGPGTEMYIGISRSKLNTAVAALKDQGYKVSYLNIEQVGNPGKYTTMKVITKEDTTYKDIYANRDKIDLVTGHSIDGGRSYLGLKPIQMVDSKRISIKYAEDGGTNMDGVIELRKGIKDLDMGDAKYAQVRIGVDGTKYLKGMAVYSDNLPIGIDIQFNTNKSNKVSKMDVLKDLKNDPDNPFGATIKPNGQRGALNIINEEGDWAKWGKTLSSQMLSKQPTSLAKQQLDKTFAKKKKEFDEINALTNPVVKKKLLSSFADDVDSAAVHLKAAGLPRTAAHVILPFPKMKDTEVYAPQYKNGEKVVLIRHPHGGKFEIPELTVNNKYPPAKNMLGNAKDAIGINHKVAERLSGADFDGDSVLVIPNNKRLVKTSSALKGLSNFDPKESYPAYPGMKKMTSKTKGIKMGDISNLITDMTIKGANTDEIARAVKHSMVVIDAEKHNLNYTQSYIDNGIAGLKKKYQGKSNAGASTLISKASSEQRIRTRKELTPDPKTGKKRYQETNESYVNKAGKTIFKTTKSSKMAETNDAFSLSSGTRMETVYATYANKLKDLGNKSRKIVQNTRDIVYSPSAKKVYNKEVSELNAALNIALKNKPLERKAQLLANKVVSDKRSDNPNMEADDLKKIKSQALMESRIRVGANKQKIQVTPKQWEAIQAGAVSTNTLKQILDNTDETIIKEYATPRKVNNLSSGTITRAQDLLISGRTQSEVAEILGVSINVLNRELDKQGV